MTPSPRRSTLNEAAHKHEGETPSDSSKSAAQPRVKRTLALTVRAGTPERDIELFERSLAAMPEHIPEIRSWALSRMLDRTRCRC